MTKVFENGQRWRNKRFNYIVHITEAQKVGKIAFSDFYGTSTIEMDKSSFMANFERV